VELIKMIKIERVDGESGFTLIEVLIAIGIFAIGFLAVGLMQINAMNTANSARRTTEALTVAEDWVEQLRALPFYNEDLDLDGDGAVEDFDMLPDLSINAVGAFHTAPADATPYTVRWQVRPGSLPDFSTNILDPLNPVPRSLNIRVWVTPDNNANDIQAEIFFTKYWSMDKRL